MLKLAFVLLFPFVFLACAKDNSSPSNDHERFNQLKAKAATTGVFISDTTTPYDIVNVSVYGVGSTDNEILAAIDSLKEFYNAEFEFEIPNTRTERRIALRNAIIDLQDKRTKLLAKVQNCEASKTVASPTK